MQATQEQMKQDFRFLSTEVNSLAEKSTTLLRTSTALQKKVQNLEARGGSNDSSTPAGLERLQTNVLDLDGKYNQAVETNRRLENELREKGTEITQLRERLDRIDTSMAATTVRLSDMGGPSPGQAMTSCNGTILWRIEDFTQKRRDAVSGTLIAIYSPHFYSSQFGYRMCARVYMNGDGFGKGSHISLFFVVMKGEYDALLPWPFQKKITMMLLDQNNGEHMIDAFRSDPESSSFQRPKNNMNVASGSPLFMPLNGLSDRAYVKDDTMFIKIIVD